MKNRKILYGYQIQNGEVVTTDTEAQVVSRVFTLYAGGASYQKISDVLNAEKIPYSIEGPLWNKHKVKRLLENPRYMGANGYPPVITADTFHATQDLIRSKTADYEPKQERPALRLKPLLRCAGRGKTLNRLAGKGRQPDTLYLKCAGCGTVFTISDADLLEETARQVWEHDTPAQETYQPSEEVVRLTNAINRALERVESPEETISLILRGAGARYDCCPAVSQPRQADRPPAMNWARIQKDVSCITLSEYNSVSVIF